MLTNLWGDGLPVWPATRERVDWILQRQRRFRARTSFGKFPPRGGVTTVETCAIALAMAGGRPEYLPVLDRRGRSGARARFELRSVAGDFRRAVPGGHRQRPDREADPAQLGLRLPRSRSAAARGRAASAARCACCSRTSAARCRASARWRSGARCATRTSCSPRTRKGLPEGWQPHGTERHGFERGTQLGLARLRDRRHQRPPAQREEGNARGRRAAGPVAHGGLHAHAEPRRADGLRGRHARHHDRAARRRADDGGAGLDEAEAARVSVGELEDPGRST